MKKLMILVFMFVIAVPMVNAEYVTTSPGGFPGGSLYNGGMYNSTNNFGENASFLPQNRAREANRQRQMEYEKEYLENTKNVNVNINGFPMNGPFPNNHYGYYNNRYYNNGYSRYYGNGYNHPGRVFYNNGNSISIPGVRMY